MNIKELAEKHYVCIEFERGDVHTCYEFSMKELEQFAELVAAATRARCIELVLAGSAMPVQTRTLEALQRDRKRIAKLIEEDGKP
jgi:hypothetical protein